MQICAELLSGFKGFPRQEAWMNFSKVIVRDGACSWFRPGIFAASTAL